MRHFCEGCFKPISEVGRLRPIEINKKVKMFCGNCYHEKKKSFIRKRFNEVFDKVIFAIIL
jgi:hypothetical protein